MIRSRLRPALLAAILLTPLFHLPVRAQVDPQLVHRQAITSYTNATTCTACHTTVAAEVMQTTHWTWEYTDPKTGDHLGKNQVINNYCIALPSNEPRCTSCHIGLGYADSTFDFADASKVDCLVCHDTTGTYKKFPTGAGHPVYGETPKEFPAGSGILYYPPNLVHVAQSVGKSSRATCGACHFYGGGGDAVKHGDLDSTLTNPTRNVDVHMGTDGLDANCAFCHIEQDAQGRGHHAFLGSHYTQEAGAKVLSCEKCHGDAPHADVPLLNQHATKVACQTCHIPAFARGGRATKMTWDWSTAGRKTPDGKTYIQKDAKGNPVYDTQKGSFTWKEHVTPDYLWFNGEVDYVTMDDVIDPTQRLKITALMGNRLDPRSKLYPVKRFQGRQPYDAGTGTLAIPHLYPRNTNDNAAYWRGYNWTNAVAAGMTYAGKTFSGQVGFVNTEMFWVQNHMVAPKEQALWCTECHTPRSRIDFAALGYPADEALRLQNMAGFEIDAPMILSEGRRLQLTWTATPGYSYLVQTSTDLRRWSPAAGGEFGPSETISKRNWTEPEGAAPPAVRFYRILRDVR
jgi:octaheme c-type cytochrome (tetrathionate reductase family)